VIRRFFVATLVTVAFAVGGCGILPNEGRNTLGGAAVGAALGFVAGTVAGVPGTGAAIGAALGGSGGVVADVVVASRREAADAEALSRAIADGNPGALAAYNEGLAEYRAQVQRELEDAAYDRGRRGLLCC
jgi:hypothetical protein